MATTLRELVARVVFRMDPAKLDELDTRLDAAKQKLLGLIGQAKKGIRPEVDGSRLAAFGENLKAADAGLKALGARSAQVAQELKTQLEGSAQNFLGLRVAAQDATGALDPAKIKEYAAAFSHSEKRAEEARKAIDRLRLVDPKNAELPELERQLNEVEKEAREAAAALDRVGVATKQAKPPADGFKGGLGQLGNAIAGLGTAAAAYKAIQFGVALVQEAKAVGNLAAQLDLGTDELQTWSALAGQVGASNEDLSGTVKALANNIKAAAEGAEGPAAVAFKRLGISTDGWAKKMPGTMDVLLAAGGALSGLEGDTERLAITQQLLGEAGLKLLPAFKGGASAAKEQLAQLRELAVVYDEEFIASSAAASAEMDLFGRQLKGVGVEVVLAVLPALRDMLRWLSPVVKNVREFIKHTNVLNAAFVVLTGFGMSRVLGTAGKLITRFGGLQNILKSGARFAARFVAPLLILDDLITFLRGGKSVIGDILDAMFGAGAAQEVVEGLHDAWDAVLGAASSLWDTLKVIVDAFFDTGEEGEAAAERTERAFIRASEGIGKAFDGLFDELKSIWDELVDVNKEMGPKTLAEAAAIERGEIAPRKLGENRDPRYQKGGELYGENGRGVGPTLAERSREAFAQAFPMPSTAARNAASALALGGSPAVGSSKSTTTVTVHDHSQITSNLNGVDSANVGPALRQTERNIAAQLKRNKAQVLRQTVGVGSGF